jgi:hypothetical protein
LINFHTYIPAAGRAIFRKGQVVPPGRKRNFRSILSSYASPGSRNAGFALTLLTFGLLPSSGYTQNSLQPPSASGFTAIATPTIVLTAYSMDGTNAGTARLGRNVTILASTAGVSGASYTWSLAGAGSLSASGVYTAPTAMPASDTAIVTATLASDSTVSTAYQMSLEYAVPTIRWIQPTTLLTGKTTAVTLTGYDFTSATSILVNGTSVPSAFQAPATIVAQIPVQTGTTVPLSIVASNPAPGGGLSLATTAATQTPSIVLTAYSGDGTNSGIGRLGRNVTIQASAPGVSGATFNWSLSGAGSVSSSGVYAGPAAMPANKSVTVTATLASNSGISSSYTMSLEYEPPTIRWINPTKLITGTTNAVTVVGYDFTPATTIQVNGVTVATTVQSPGALIAQVVVPDDAVNTRSFVAKNPGPGGGESAPEVATLQSVTIQLSSYNKTGLNPSTDPLGGEVQYIAVVQGSGDPNATWSIRWSVVGGGSISSTGLYRAPTAMPAGGSVTVTATLKQVNSVQTSAQLVLQNPTPVVNQSYPTQLVAGKTNAVTFNGEGFEPGTQLFSNGTALATTVLSSSSLSVSIPVSSDATAPLSITAQNPSPGGGTSKPFALLIASGTTVSATIGSQPGLSIPADFLGLSHDWNDAQASMGSQATGVNNIYRQLVQNLSNPQKPFFIRIGGGSTDDSVAPTSLTVQPFVELAQAMPVRFSLGVNLGSNNVQLAEQQASFFASQLPASALDAIEIGNDPDLYAQNGRRSSSYNLSNYVSDFAEWQSNIQPLIPSTTRIMGAAWASPWYLQQNFVALEQQQSNNLPLVSQHFYAGHQGTNTSFPYDYLLKSSTLRSAPRSGLLTRCSRTRASVSMA